MKFSSIFTTLVVGSAAVVSLTDAALTSHSTTYDLMSMHVRRDMHAVTQATLETRKPDPIKLAESFVVAVESLLGSEDMDFDVYRKQRQGLYDQLTKSIGATASATLVGRAGAIAKSNSGLDDLSLALYAPAAASDFFFDIAEAILRTIKADTLLEDVKDKRAEVEDKIKNNVNPAWIAAHLYRVLSEIDAQNKSVSAQIGNTKDTLLQSMEDEYGSAKLV